MNAIEVELKKTPRGPIFMDSLILKKVCYSMVDHRITFDVFSIASIFEMMRWPGLPAEYAGPYQQDCIGLLLSSPQDSTTSTLPIQGRSTKTRIGSCVVEDRLLQRRTRRTTCDFTGSSPASHQRRCSLRRQPPTSRPCQPCSAEIYIGSQSVSEYFTRCASWCSALSMEQRRRTWLHGHAHLQSPRSVSSPFCAEGLFDVPRTRTVFGSRAFSIAGPVAWNGLPVHVRAIRDVIPFKSALKTHFFQLAYPNSL